MGEGGGGRTATEIALKYCTYLTGTASKLLKGLDAAFESIRQCAA